MADLDTSNAQCTELRSTPQSIVPSQCRQKFADALAACTKVDEAVKTKADKLKIYTDRLDAYNAVKVDENDVQAAIDAQRAMQADNEAAKQKLTDKIQLLNDLLNNTSSSGQSYNSSTPLSSTSVSQLKQAIKDANDAIFALAAKIAAEKQAISDLSKKLSASKAAKQSLDTARIALDDADSLLKQAIDAASTAYTAYKQCKGDDTQSFISGSSSSSSSSSGTSNSSSGASSSSRSGSTSSSSSGSSSSSSSF
jgi:DNA repair exonuclease SbcCD ATPase subunit